MIEKSNAAAANSICVFSGSAEGNEPDFLDAADEFGKILALNGKRLVCGGIKVGLMRRIGESVLRYGGDVIAFTPEFLVEREGAAGRGQEIIVKDMHERKRRMCEEAAAFVAFPGGIGTLEESVEQMTWEQLGRHKKPVVLANIKGFWGPLISLLEQMETIAFINSCESKRVHVRATDNVYDILPMIFGEKSGGHSVLRSWSDSRDLPAHAGLLSSV